MPAAPANTVVYGRAEHRKNWYHFVCDLGTARQNDGENMTDQAKTTIKVDWIDLDSIDSILSKVSGSAFRWVQNILEPVRSRPGLYPLHISMCLPSILVLLTSPLPLKCVCLAQHVILRSLSLSLIFVKHYPSLSSFLQATKTSFIHVLLLCPWICCKLVKCP